MTPLFFENGPRRSRDEQVAHLAGLSDEALVRLADDLDIGVYWTTFGDPDGTQEIDGVNVDDLVRQALLEVYDTRTAVTDNGLSMPDGLELDGYDASWAPERTTS